MNEHPNLNNKLNNSNNDDDDGNDDDDNDNNRMKENDILETKEAMRLYFRYTAHYIVVAKEYMRDDQLSGGTGVDEGRVW